jgi:hypothetical protein
MKDIHKKILYLLENKYKNLWPSDHDILISDNGEVLTWNVESPKQTDKIGLKYRNIKLFETNMAFIKRAEITIDILSDIMNLSDIKLLFLQEVDLELILMLAKSNIYNNFIILFKSDIGKPKGQVILLKKHSFLINAIDPDTYIVRRKNRHIKKKSKNNMTFKFQNEIFYFDYIKDITKSELLLSSNNDKGKTYAFKLKLLNKLTNKEILYIGVHLDPLRKQHYGILYSDLYSNTDSSNIVIVGDFNRRYSEYYDSYKGSYIDHILHINNNNITDEKEIFRYSTKYFYNNNIIKNILGVDNTYSNEDISKILLSSDKYRNILIILRGDIIVEKLNNNEINTNQITDALLLKNIMQEYEDKGCIDNRKDELLELLDGNVNNNKVPLLTIVDLINIAFNYKCKFQNKYIEPQLNMLIIIFKVLRLNVKVFQNIYNSYKNKDYFCLTYGNNSYNSYHVKN